MDRTPSGKKRFAQEAARLVSGLTLIAFLLAQSWVQCAPLCLAQMHGESAATGSHFQNHLLHCHSGKVMPSEFSAAQPLESMLPVQLTAPLLLPRILTISFAPAAPVHFREHPPADPPPPRLV